MTARILRLELRRSAAPWLVLLSTLTLVSYEEVGEGLGSIAGLQRGALLSWIPLALGVGAWQARRDRRSRTEELVATTPLPRWRRVLPTAAALGIAAATGSLLVFAGLAVYGVVVGAYVPVFSVPFAVVTAVYLVAGAWAGLAVGRVLRFRLAPPLVVVVGVVAMTFVALSLDNEGGGNGPSPGTRLLEPSQSNIGPFVRIIWPVIGAQALWAVGLAAAALILFTASRTARLAAVVPVALALAAALPLLPRFAHEAQAVDPGAVALMCTPDGPRVCVTRAHHRTLGDLRAPAREALAIMSAKLPQAPTSVVELYSIPGGYLDVPPQRDTVFTWLMNDDRGRIAVSDREVTLSLLIGAGTQVCENAVARWGSAPYDTARVVAAAWLLDEEPPDPSSLDPNWWGWLPDRTRTLQAYQKLRALPADEQRARVAALREAEVACDDRDRLGILTGPGGTG